MMGPQNKMIQIRMDFSRKLKIAHFYNVKNQGQIYLP